MCKHTDPLTRKASRGRGIGRPASKDVYVYGAGRTREDRDHVCQGALLLRPQPRYHLVAELGASPAGGNQEDARELAEACGLEVDERRLNAPG